MDGGFGLCAGRCRQKLIAMDGRDEPWDEDEVQALDA